MATTRNVRHLKISNILLSILKRTRNAVNYIVKPHPSFEIPCSYPSPRASLVISATAKKSPTPSEYGWEAVNASILERNSLDVESGIFRMTSEDSTQHTFSLYRHLPQSSTTGRGHTLRRTKCSIARRQKSVHSSSLSHQEPHYLAESFADSPPRQLGPKPLSPILEQGDSPGPDPGIISPTISTDSLGNSADSAIHFVDEDSGTIFSRAQRVTGTCISTEQFALEASSLKSSLSLHIGSTPACAATDLDEHVESLPSFVLMLPTPVSPHSPIFSSEVQFTTERFLGTAEAAAPNERVPTLLLCGHEDGGKLCRACEMQLFACRALFQNADDRAWAALRELFVRPTQSTVHVRAVLSSLGFGTRYASGVGLGLASSRDENCLCQRRQ
ncbi:hypothetical protein F5148DRAFT_178229 [Russula earlei]|uniref:Uncharacterized protein n=1 Tax=Russula earlei TaxID=71964 RepID=A0ACC0UJP2_9AGAM|nr:hypothetical protein F5148DRAFT_178229 [Russula earlei]